MVDSSPNPFRRFVSENQIWFAGRLPESSSSISATEASLGVLRPDDVSWLLSAHGYWHATGICSLTDTVREILIAHKEFALPDRLVVLYDDHDGGVVLLDTDRSPETAEHSAYITGWEFVPDNITADVVFPLIS